MATEPRSVDPGYGLRAPTLLNRASDLGEPVSPTCYSIRTFCIAHSISEDMFFKLQRQGLAPRTMRVGARTLISVEAAAEWRREREVAPIPDNNLASVET